MATDAAQTAREFAERFAAEDADAARDAADLLSEDGREGVVDAFPEDFQEGPMDAADALESYWWGLHTQYGAFEDVVDVTVDGDEAAVTFTLADGSETATVELGENGVAGFAFDPEYEPPAYADEDAFEERDVTVDAGDVTLDGVLAVPEGDGPFPGVVLVHGAGIHDPDGTAGNSKILKDVAWGLASEGVAVLRYEKRLRDHDVPDAEKTLDRVVVDDAVAAVDELAAEEAVAEDAVFVAGHSQGGMAAPTVAGRHGRVAGVVAFDSPADPTPDPDDLSFMRYGIDPEGDLTEEEEAMLEAQRETFERIAAGDYEDDEELMGEPGRWHRTVRGSDPAGTASALDAPTFVAKASRADEDVQPELYAFQQQGLADWEAVDLPSGSQVEQYEGADHYFQTGATPATMDGLYFGGNVTEAVVADLAAWIHDTADA
jgi:pimeloyl-ACP methyl ester carboxylesterase